MTAEERIAAVAALAADWQDPDHPARAAAVEATLGSGRRYTEEGLAFALNHRMHQLTAPNLRAWIGEAEAPEPRTVAVTPTGEAPLAGLEEALAAALVGHRAVLDAEDVTPAVRQFVETVSPLWQNKTSFERHPERSADAWILAGGTADSEAMAERAEAAGIPEERRFTERMGYAVAVTDGQEDRAAWSGLAEDFLLHDGLSEASPRLVWVPRGTSPDALLDALAGFRELFPPHADTDGTLSLPAAFLAAADQPRATGPGFLVSLGEPEPQGPAHVRWTEYDTLAEVREWLAAHEDAVRSVVATPEVGGRLETSIPVVPPGDAHRPALNPRLVAFLRAL